MDEAALQTFVNGDKMTKFKVDIKNSLVRYERELKNNDRIIFGAATTFLVVFPIKEYNEDN